MKTKQKPLVSFFFFATVDRLCSFHSNDVYNSLKLESLEMCTNKVVSMMFSRWSCRFHSSIGLVCQFKFIHPFLGILSYTNADYNHSTAESHFDHATFLPTISFCFAHVKSLLFSHFLRIDFMFTLFI